ncbi:DUF2059 domain-containing protein [Sphingomonas lenta]|uniref:DUF2059 domain-containing protein n=1 Tax=Sphingomonas lenta TaxID=1141887 RepID=UPI0015956448|nr:DUF2059 domain-containing protein [Sphingomonas lenta]
MSVLVSVMVLMCATPVSAQTAAAAPAQAVDAARLEAARALMDVLMPPATREQMMQGMMAPLMANIERGMAADPQFAAAIGSDPRVKALFDEFTRKQMARTTELIRTSLPGMIDAIAKAYARRFDVAQLGELRRFFETPTGRAYVRDSMTIMADPDVAQWQQDLMTRSMTDARVDVEEIARRVAALEPGRTP